MAEAEAFHHPGAHVTVRGGHNLTGGRERVLAPHAQGLIAVVDVGKDERLLVGGHGFLGADVHVLSSSALGALEQRDQDAVDGVVAGELRGEAGRGQRLPIG